MIRKFDEFLSESTTGEFKGKKGFFGKSAEYKRYEADHKEIAKYREIAKILFDEIDKYKYGQVAEMWNEVYDRLGRFVGLGNIFGQSGKESNAMTSLSKPADRAPWSYAMGWDGTVYVKDMDSIHTYTTGFGYVAKSGNDKDLLKMGFNQVYSWLKTILYSVMNSEEGYQDFEDGTFFNCKNGRKIRERFANRI